MRHVDAFEMKGIGTFCSSLAHDLAASPHDPSGRVACCNCIIRALSQAATAPTPPRRAPAGSHRRASARPRRPEPASPELPIAISTLRTKRSRPMRLTGDLANSARKAASSSRASSASAGSRSSARADKFCLAADLRELVPGADGEAIVAAIDAVADRFAEFARDRPLVLDGQIRDAAPRIELVGRGEGRGRADVQAGVAGAAMIDIGRHRAAGRMRRRSRRETARSRTRARPGWCACPASRGPRPAPAAFPSRRRCRRTPSPRRRSWRASQRASAFRRFLMTS